MKKYNKYRTSGWYNESQRHSLARQGVKTGRKDYSRDISLSGVTYEPITVGTEIPKEMKDTDVMNDVDMLMAESEEQRNISPEEAEISIPQSDVELQEESVKEESILSKEIDEDLSELEKEEDSSNILRKSFGDSVKEKIREYTLNALQAIRDTNIEGIEKHISNLEEEKLDIQDKVNILNSLKEKIKSRQYRDDVGVAKQLRQLNRVNKLILAPSNMLRIINNTVSKLERKKISLLSQKNVMSNGPKKPSVYGSIFPSFGEVLHPERLRK